MTELIRILGVDPGSVVTGYGLIETDGIRSFHVAHGSIRAVGENFPDRLGVIYTELSTVLEKWQPAEVAIEQVFVSKNAMSALKLGQARGAAISAVVTRSISVSEYTPRSVKQAVAGTGAADKKQVQVMIRSMLGITESLQADAADGLAIAICHAHSRMGKGLGIRRGQSRRGGRSANRALVRNALARSAKVKS